MQTIRDLSSPIKIYSQAKEAFKNNIDEYFSTLLKESNTNLDVNKQTCDSYYKKLSEVEDTNKSLKKKKRFKSFLNFIKITCFITIVLIPLGLFINSKIKNKVNKEIEDINNLEEKKKNEAEGLKSEAIKQTNLLNSMYDWNICSTLFSKTLPLIELDKNFSVSKFAYLHDRYGYKEHKESDVSTVFVQSGSILGNPFVVEKNYVSEIGNYLYTGTLIISWTTYTTDSQGHSHAVHHTQTLVAHLSKPKPYYYLDTWLVYGNPSAPKLKFSREPSNTKGMDEKAIKRLATKTEKNLIKRSEKDANFTQMGNSKFEALFHAFNRNNEVEFRLLFTPLAQNNMIDLISAKEPFGDDFFFYKNECLNYIKSAHSQGFDYSNNPINFVNFDLTKAKAIIDDYSSQYFDNLFFDLAPILSIPLYQNQKATEYIYKDNNKNRVTSFEVESLVNNYDKGLFAHKDTKSSVILKADYMSRDKNADLINITAYSYKTIPHVDFVPTLGGDGFMHPVPVHWDEYIPVKKITPILVSEVGSSRFEINKNNKNVFTNKNVNNVYYQKGLMSALLNKKGE